MMNPTDVKAQDMSHDLGTDLMFLNLGPSHPASHGTLRTFVALDGETIVSAVSEIGYLHRGFEKMSEQGTWNQVIPYTDRLNYCSAISNNVAFAKAVERMLDIEVTDRCKFMRVILTEFSRIIDHLVCNAANLLDMGGLTNYWYLYNPREEAYDFLSRLTGARLTNSFTRIGGMYKDFHDGWQEELEAMLQFIEKGVMDSLGLVKKNRIVQDRAQNICCVTPEEALQYGFTGPCLRASGVPFDQRRDNPYYYYDEFEFDIPVGEKGDIWDRIMVRFMEIFESARIIRQAVKKIPGGPVSIKDPKVTLPDKQDVYGNIEGLMNQFKLIFEGVQVPAGEVYDSMEATNGELGFYMVSDGSGRPYKIKVRPPCFYMMQAYPETIEGNMIADAIIQLGSVNIIAGELDR